MKVCVRRAERGETVREGRAIDLRAFDLDSDLDASAVARAVRRDVCLLAGDRGLAVDCPDPGPAHEYVGAITADSSLARRAALAAAARSRGHAAPQDDELATVRDRLDALAESSTVADRLREARERVADASDAEAEWRERVATLQGRVQALREVDTDSTDAGADLAETEADLADAEADSVDAEADLADAEADLAEATRRLSEVETERIAAEQALARARERARDRRETRRERLHLEDRAGNLRRAAREHLAERVADDFEAARDEVPDDELPGEVGDALAVARVADLDAPVVLASSVSPFATPETAVEWFDAPVLLI